MLVVYKYELPMEDRAAIMMPPGARVLHVAEQNGVPCLWALVAPLYKPVKRLFRVAGTGHELNVGTSSLADASGRHVGTFLADGGRSVWHVFDLGEVSA